LRKKQRHNNDRGTSVRSHTKNQGPKLVMGSLDAKIVEDLLKNAFVSSTEISKRHKIPLSTVQRRRRHLENTILIRRYEIDLKKQGFRIGELTVFPENGAEGEIYDKIFSRYADHIVSISVKIDGSIILAVLLYFKTTAEVRNIMTGIHSMPEVANVKFAEVVEIIRDRRSQTVKTILP
jgi:DNA-binding Lrp family transcriptional regulator